MNQNWGLFQTTCFIFLKIVIQSLSPLLFSPTIHVSYPPGVLEVGDNETENYWCNTKCDFLELLSSVTAN